MKAYITKPTEYGKVEIRVELTEEEKKNHHDISTWYTKISYKKGIYFGRIEMAGDRLDGWATHVYHIAIKKIKRGYKVLGWMERQYGWHGTHGGMSPKIWRNQIIEREEKENGTLGQK